MIGLSPSRRYHGAGGGGTSFAQDVMFSPAVRATTPDVHQSSALRMKHIALLLVLVWHNSRVRLQPSGRFEGAVLVRHRRVSSPHGMLMLVVAYLHPH